MERETRNDETNPPTPPQPMSKLFRVLVVGGVLLAAALAGSAIHGATGSSDSGDDGGVQGW